MPQTADRKDKTTNRVLIGFAIVVSIVSFCIVPAMILNFFHNNNIETEYIVKVTPSILRERYQNGYSRQSQDMIWPELIYKNHPSATHFSNLKVYSALPYLKYVHVSIRDEKGWHSYQFQVDHYKLFHPKSDHSPITIKDPVVVKRLESKQASLLD